MFSHRFGHMWYLKNTRNIWKKVVKAGNEKNCPIKGGKSEKLFHALNIFLYI